MTNMIRHRSTVLLAACVTSFGLVLDASYTPALEPAIAQSSVTVPTPTPILAQSPALTPTQQPLLKRGSQGSEVTELQTLLKQLGHYNGVADGIFGDSTQEAVSKFQKSVGLESDGIVATSTREQLQKAKAAKEAASAAIGTPKAAKGEARKPPSWGRRIGVLVAIIAIAGSAAFFLLKWFGKPKKVAQPKSQPDAANPSTENSLGKGIEPKTEPQNSELDNNSYNNSAFTVSLPNSEKTQPEIEQSSAPLAINQTTRLAKINIVDELIKELQGPDPQKRRKAIWDLAQQGDSRAVQPLVDLMLDADSTQRSLILEALSQIGTKTLQPMNRALAVSLQDDNAEVRKNAIRDLTQIYDIVAQISQLLSHAVYDCDPEVRETAQWAMSQLSRIRTPVTRETLPPGSNPPISSENQRQEPPQ